jgi:hypothetical protein
MALHLDHIIILVPYDSLVSLPEWITTNFTVTPGGIHADGKTENKLICFRDGCYIELIAFIKDDPSLREDHFWGDKKFGIIDFAFTSRSDDAPTLFLQLEKRLRELDLGKDRPKVEYQPPVSGGRTRPDGQEVKWNVTFPVANTGYQRGELPFFCHDLTPRNLRVPFTEESVTHPNGAYGIDEMYIYASEERCASLAQAYSAILGVPNTVDETDPNFVGMFETTRFNEISGAEAPVFVVGMPLEEEQLEAMQERDGVLLASLTLGSVEEGSGLLRRIDLGDEGVGGIIAPAIRTRTA